MAEFVTWQIVILYRMEGHRFQGEKEIDVFNKQGTITRVWGTTTTNLYFVNWSLDASYTE